jgi:hypothetical protein
MHSLRFWMSWSVVRTLIKNRPNSRKRHLISCWPWWVVVVVSV